jgi:hypothetical protein
MDQLTPPCVSNLAIIRVGATFVMRNYIRWDIGIYIYNHISTTVLMSVCERVTLFQTLIKTVVQL